MALQGNGLDDDWTMVLEMCSQEIVSLEGSCPMLTQQHHNKISTSGSKSSCLMPTHWHHNKHNNQMISNSCMPHAPMYLRDYPKVTLLGGPLSHAHLHRGNSVPELHNGFCQSLAKQHHNKMINATDFDPGDINTESDHVDEKEAICDELARHYAQHGLKDPEGYFDLADEEVQTIMSRDLGGKGTDGLRDVGAVKLNVFEQSGDSESIENLSGHENSEDEEFLGYYTVGPDGRRRPIPAPRRLIRMRAAKFKLCSREHRTKDWEGSCLC